jgi:galactokinase
VKPEPLRERFGSLFGGGRARVALAPGRVNLIGEHTDYNDGFVLPMAIDRHVGVAFRARDDRTIRAHALDFGETREADLAALRAPGGHGWFDYVAGTAWSLRAAGLPVGGIDAVIGSDVPVGAGLSSSAAIETAVARALCAAAGLPFEPREMAVLCRRAENEYVGVGCGIMDQFASAASRDGCALLLDCRSLATEWVTIPAEAAVVVMDTGVRRSLASGAYNERRAACEATVAVLRRSLPDVLALRDVSFEELAAQEAALDPVTFRRAAHVVREIERPALLARAFASRELALAGRLMDESHASLRDLYEVSCAELDLVCAIARGHVACFGARMTGAGFGGCAVALVSAGGAPAFVREVEAAYREQSGLPGALFACRPAAGARLAD